MDFSSAHTLLADTLTHWPTDWFIIGLIAALVALDSFRNGTSRAVSIALSLPLAFFLYGALAQAYLLDTILAQFSSPHLHAAAFLALAVGAYILVRRMIGPYGNVSGGLASALIAGVGVAIVAVVVWQSAPIVQAMWMFSPQVQAVFGETYRLWLLVAAYLMLAFASA